MASREAPVSSTRSIDISAPPEVVWDVLTRFGDWPKWNPDVKSMSFDGPVEPGSTFRWKAGPRTILSTLVGDVSLGGEDGTASVRLVKPLDDAGAVGSGGAA